MPERTDMERYTALAKDATAKRDWPAVARHYRAIGDLLEIEQMEEEAADGDSDA